MKDGLIIAFTYIVVMAILINTTRKRDKESGIR